MVSVGEGEGQVTVCYEITQIASDEIISQATALTREASGKAAHASPHSSLVPHFVATPNVDYIPLTSALVGFTAASTVGDVQCVNLTIIDDSELEETKQFFLELEIIYTENNFPNSRHFRQLFNIIDNDG